MGIYLLKRRYGAFITCRLNFYSFVYIPRFNMQHVYIRDVMEYERYALLELIQCCSFPTWKSIYVYISQIYIFSQLQRLILILTIKITKKERTKYQHQR